MGILVLNVPDHDKSMSESFKFIRMTEDIQHMSNYLNDIRICFIAITLTIYIVLITWFILFCVRRNRRNVNNGGNVRRPRSTWDYQVNQI
jgi:heme/copper-type cytochrome/quinol oxidase subunit 2